MDKKTEKKPSNLKRLFSYAGNFRFLTVASIILSAVSAVEATASLDVENETMIQESPRSLSRIRLF